MQHMEGSGTPVLYIGRTVLNGYGVQSSSAHLGSQRFTATGIRIILMIG